MVERIRNDLGKEVGHKSNCCAFWFGDKNEAGNSTENMVGEIECSMYARAALYVGNNCQRQRHIGHSLTALGFELHKASTITWAKEKVATHRYRLILIHFDTMGKETFTFCSFIHSCSPHTILIVLMSSIRIKIEEQLFNCGVNDVVTGKQTSSRVLAKRIQAHLQNNKPFSSQTNTIRLKNTLVDFDRREVRHNGTVRQLPGILADLLRYFIDNPSRAISREELQKSPIWADSICSDPQEGGKTFDVNISKLRKIIEPEPLHPQIIITVRGIGWKLALDSVRYS